MDSIRLDVDAVRNALPVREHAAGRSVADSADQIRLQARVAELEGQLVRERARNRGLEHGLSALSQRTAALRAELEERG